MKNVDLAKGAVIQATEMINKECPIVMDKICRSCMSEGDEMRSVFDTKEQEAGQSVQLATMLMACASVMVEKEDGLPPLLCITCEQQLSNAYQFKQQCEKTDTTLRGYTTSGANATRIKQEAESTDIIVKPDIHSFDSESQDDADDKHDDGGSRRSKKRSRLSCKYCNKGFVNKKSLEMHQRKHKGEKLTCYKCQATFHKANHLLAHVKTHKDHVDSKHKCFQCGMTFNKAYHLVKHKKEHIIAKTIIKEEMISKAENEEDDDEPNDLPMETIIERDDSSESEQDDPYFPAPDKSEAGTEHPCTYCGKILTTYSGLQIHMRRHTGSNLANCPVCDKSFTKNSHLKRHMLTHTAAEKQAAMKEKQQESKEKKYLECEFCDRKFVYRKSFQHHVETEHGVSDDSDTPLSNYTKKDVVKIEVEPSLPVAEGTKTENADDDLDSQEMEVEYLEPIEDQIDEKKMVHTCHVCEAKFARPNHLTRHMTLHRAILIHKCDKCEKAFATEEHLSKHVQEYHVDRPYVCSICERPFSRGEHLIRHLKIHNKDNNPKEEHKCSICDKIFARSDHLARHTKLHLQQDKRHVCSECGKAFNRLDNLRTHQRVHTGMKDQQRLHLCIYCGKEFNNSSNMIVHMRRHTGERPYKCTQCGKGFPRSHDLKCHERTHSGEKPYLCTLCGKSFNKSNKLLRHSRVHTGERPYVCNLCGRAFTQSNDLALHMRRHTGARPYACGMCPARFIQSGQLKAHRRSQGHWVETPPDLKGGHRVSPVTPITNPVPIKFKTRVNKLPREPRILEHTIGIMGTMEAPIMVDGAKILESFQNAAALASFAAGHSVINTGQQQDGLKLSAEVIRTYTTNQNPGVDFGNPNNVIASSAAAAEEVRRIREAGTPIDIDSRASTSTFQSTVECNESGVIFSTSNITPTSNTFTSSGEYSYQSYG